MPRSVPRFGPRAVSLAYVALGSLWILLSGQAVLGLSAGDASLLAVLEAGKGWAYVLGSGALLWGLVHGRDRALAISAKRFYTLARLAPVAIFRADAAGRCVYVNERFCAISGLAASAALGNGWAACVHPDDRVRVVDDWTRSVRERSPFRTEYRVLAADGSVQWMLAEVAEERDGGGRIVGYVGTLTDITERKLADDDTRRLADDLETRVAERAAQLEATVRELDTFSYTVSHDLRAPLRSISGFSQMILEETGETLPPRARSHLERVIAASRRMSEMIDGLMDLARVARSPLRGEWVDVSALAETVFDELRAEEPARVVETRVAPGIRLWGDPTLLRIALENLQQNAWKFTQGVEGARIVVEPATEGPGVAVRDNGAGFDMAWQDKLFRAFERLHGPEVFPGSGIGLATVHRIVARHGGRVWASGRVGEGASFGFSVPPGPDAAVGAEVAAPPR